MGARPDEGSLGKAYTAGEITVYYERVRCRHYAECVRGLPDVFDSSRRPWIRAELADRDRIAEVVRRCPTGALHYRLASGDPERPLEPTSIHRDPGGPLLVSGDLVLDTPAGTIRETRAALCRCGATTLEPFCDGTCSVNDHRPPGTREEAKTEQVAATEQPGSQPKENEHDPAALNTADETDVTVQRRRLGSRVRRR